MFPTGSNEVKVVVRVTDLNDNIPRFTISGKPIVAAIPSSAGYGYQVIRLQVPNMNCFVIATLFTKCSLITLRNYFLYINYKSKRGLCTTEITHVIRTFKKSI